MLEGFLEKVGANAAEVHFHQVLEADSLFAGQVARSLQEDPLGLGEDGLFARKRKTLMFNGYEAQVGQLYAGMDLKKFF